MKIWIRNFADWLDEKQEDKNAAILRDFANNLELVEVREGKDAMPGGFFERVFIAYLIAALMTAAG